MSWGTHEDWCDYQAGQSLYLCDQCEKYEKTIDDARQAFNHIVKLLYIDKKLDTGKLERYMDDLTSILDADFGTGEMNIANQISPKVVQFDPCEDIFSECVNLNRNCFGGV